MDAGHHHLSLAKVLYLGLLAIIKMSEDDVLKVLRIRAKVSALIASQLLKTYLYT